MSNHDKDLDWLISNEGEFLRQFGIDRDKIIDGYAIWNETHSPNSVIDYYSELLRQAALFNIKNANSEEEYYNMQLTLHTKMLELLPLHEKKHRNYELRQIHFDKLMISRVTLPFNFDIQINSNNCCSYCNKKDKKILSLEKVAQKKFIPFTKCNREDDCICTYSIVPLNGITEKE